MLETAPRVSSRIDSLDGLRGIAAVVVLLSHLMLAFAPVADREFAHDGPGGHLVVDVLVFSPLHVFWDGQAAVTVFFVLSGLVLTLPVIRAEPRYRWGAYLRSRPVRIYLPVIAAVVVAAVMMLAVDRSASSLESSRYALYDEPLEARTLAQEMLLVTTTPSIVPSLWSLVWEIQFSLLLPLYVLPLLYARRRGLALAPAAAAAALIGVAVGWLVGIAALMFLPVFMLGVVIAISAPTLTRWAARLGPRGWALLLVGAGAAIYLPRLLRWCQVPPAYVELGQAVVALGAAVVVVAAMHCPATVRLLTTRVARYLGKISFSLYLVHFPIILTIVMGLGEGRQWVSVPLAALASFAGAHVFERTVERPTHRLARRLAGHPAKRRPDSVTSRALSPAETP